MDNGFVTAVRKTYLSRIFRDTQRNTVVETAAATLRGAHLAAVAVIADGPPLSSVRCLTDLARLAHYAARNDWRHDIWFGQRTVAYCERTCGDRVAVTDGQPSQVYTPSRWVTMIYAL